MIHLYQYFGIILGCDEPSFPKYAGNPSQAAVHRYMDLKAPEMHYFIHNIYDAALTLGVAGPDLVTHVGDAISIGVGLDNIFNKKCSPPQKVATYQPSAPQSMCHDNAYVLFSPLTLHRRVHSTSSLTRALCSYSTCPLWAFPNATCAPYKAPGYGVMPALAGPVAPSASLCSSHDGGWRAY